MNGASSSSSIIIRSSVLGRIIHSSVNIYLSSMRHLQNFKAYIPTSNNKKFTDRSVTRGLSIANTVSSFKT
jgi:hypothetical protein